MNQNILYHINNKKHFLILFFLFSFILNSNAVVETYVGATKSLKTYPLTIVLPATSNPLFSECYDNKRISVLPFTSYSAAWQNDFNFKYIRNSIQVSIKRSDDDFYSTLTNIRVKLEVEAKDAFGNNIVLGSSPTSNSIYNIDLDLIYNPDKGVLENDKAIFAFQNAVWFKATVVGITDFNNTSIAPLGATMPDVTLETKIELDRIYRMDLLSTASTGFNAFSSSVNLSSLSLVLPNNCQEDKTGCTWANVAGAEEWEIEWQFIEYHNSWTNLSNNNNYLINPTNCDIDFKNNSTRVRINKFIVPSNVFLITPMPYFEIPAIYESGYLIVRVRPIGRDINTFEEIIGPWSMPTKSSGNDLTSFMTLNVKFINNFNDELNWQNNVSFAEEGKYKNVISYYDGALRNRQSVTLNTSEKTPIVGQTIYDHIGRPTIQVLPTPALDNNPNSCFRPNFNRGLGSNSAYNYSNFDLTNNNNCPSDLIVSEMDPGSGASKYYSPNGYNASTMQPWQAFVPDAQGYPFTQVEFMPDNTGRISRQSGVGPKHRLSGVDQGNNLIDGKETKFLYGKPYQEQLFRLFGNEVGKAEHFKRNVTIDPNGQASVTYIDAYGRTVATALAGDPQKTSALSPLASSNQSFNYNITSFENKTDNFNHSKTIEHTIIVTDATTHIIDYTVDPISFVAACTPEGICYDCVYDMELSLTDECGVEIIPTESRKAMVGNVLPFDMSCNAVAFNLSPSPNGLQILLQTGTYRLKKTLTINKEALEFYKKELWKNNPCLKTFDDFLAEEKAEMNMKNKCIYTCVDCEEELEKLNLRKTFLTNKGSERTTDEQSEFLTIDQLIEKQNTLCNELCKTPTPCQLLLENILVDVSPKGQYAPVSKYDDVTRLESSALNDDVNILNSNPNRVWTNGNDWRHPLNPNINGSTLNAYYNKNGTIALILVENNLPEIQSGKKYYDKNGNEWTNASAGNRYIKPHELKNVEDFISKFDPFWAHSLKYYHPEYCYYEKCKYIEPSYEFNNRMLAEDDAEEAKKKGYFNPLNIIDITNNGNDNDGQMPYYYASFEVNNMLDKEPLHNSIVNGLVYDRKHWNDYLHAYVKTDPNNPFSPSVSIWDIYNSMVEKANLSSADKNCVGDAQWPLLRSLYLSAKNNLLKDYYTNNQNCSSINSLSSFCGNGNCNGIVTIPTGKLKRFPLDADDLNNQVNFNPSTNGNNFDNGKTYTENQVKTICTERCESYVGYWRAQLQKCNLYKNLNNDTINFVNDLKKVCENGCDENNLLGAREVPIHRYKALNGAPENFYKVFEKYFGNTPNWFSAGICDDIILEWPMDYGHDYAAYEGPYADTCACKKANYATYNPECEPNNIPAPLNNCACDIKNDEVRQAALMKLDIPDDLKCQNCIDCKTFNEGYTAFVKKYTKAVVNNMSDEMFKDLVYKWMNLYLGFNLTYDEYLKFAGECSNVVSPNRASFDPFEVMKFSLLPKSENKSIEFKSIDNEPLLYLVQNNIINQSWQINDNQNLKTSFLNKEPNLPLIRNKEINNEYLLASLDDQLLSMPSPFQKYASPQAEALACHCEKILTVRWHNEDNSSSNLSDIDRYNQMFGNSPFNNQADFDNAYKVCCNAFNQSMPPQPDCQNNFKPGDQFDESHKDYLDQQILNNSNFPIISSTDYQLLIDNNCSNPLTEDNEMAYMDKCACDKLLEAKRLYALQYPNAFPNGPPNFDAYIYQLYNVVGANFATLTEKCKKFWKSGAGKDANKNEILWPGPNPNINGNQTPIFIVPVGLNLGPITNSPTWNKISIVNLKQYAKDENLKVPKGLLCEPPPPPPCKQWLPDCFALKYILAQFLVNNPPPPNMLNLGPYSTNDPNYFTYLFHGVWEQFHETFMNNKSSNTPDPTYTAFFEAFAAFANNHDLVKAPCTMPAEFSVELIMSSFYSCMPDPCGPNCKDFEYVFNKIRQTHLDQNPRPLGFDETTVWSKEWYSLILNNYNAKDAATLNYIDDYVREFNLHFQDICPKENREYFFGEIWSRMRNCFIWPGYEVPAKPPILPPKCTSCYLVDEDYLKAFQNFLNQINLGGNPKSHNPILNQLDQTGWYLEDINSTIEVTEFYNSKLYLPNNNQSQLKYQIDQNTFEVPYLEAFVLDFNGYNLNFSLQYYDNFNGANYGYIKEFLNIRALDRIGCGLAKGYELDAVVIIPKDFKNPSGPTITKNIKMKGTFYKGGYASYTNCWNTCVRLCNKPQIPKPKIEDDPCELMITRNAYSNALHKFESYKKEINKKFEEDYISHCMGVKEDFSLKFNQREYHYTLYYYDQAGNLIKTVPPEGVDITNAYMTKTCPSTRSTLTNNTVQQDFGDERITAAMAYFKNLSSNRAVTSHTLITNYQYNTLNQLIWQNTPDGGESRFWYDNLGRLVVSQNAKQLAANQYSYTLYDEFGRIKEVGEKTTTNSIDYEIAGNLSQLNGFLSSGTNRQVTRTFYDALSVSTDPVNNEFSNNSRLYLRHRVVSTHFFKETPPSGMYQGFGSDAATHYSYDIHGNVNELVQDIAALDKTNQRYKKLAYEYDLISGNVKHVHYQIGKPDQMHHRYFYDADNRLTLAETSTDGWNYTLDAKYFYYLHGPLARTELGDYNQKVQGLDYAYTLHGWIKSVNGASLNHERDLGKDGHYTLPNNANATFGRDAFGFMLHYYDGDYTPVGGQPSNFVPNFAGSNIQAFKNDLFNGNIPFMQTSLPDVTAYNANGAVVNQSLGNLYQYDQLNRLVEHRVFDNFDNTSNNWLNTPMNNGTDKFYENFTYDANGNILNINRNGANAGTGLAMDNFTYHYNNEATSEIIKPSISSTGYCVYPLKSNKLYHVNDAVAATNYTDDVDDQGSFTATPSTINTSNNYGYDEIGNLVRDDAENIQNITWNVYGKIESISRTGNNNKANLAFTYDASGQRISKTVMPRNNGVLSTEKDWKTTYYVRDPSGNVMATYTQSYTELQSNQKIKEEIKLKELHLYGSSRLGIVNAEIVMATQEYNISGYNTNNGTFENPSVSFNTLLTTEVAPLPTIYTVYKGKKQYELSNHLGNVLATISDRRVPRDDNGDLKIDYFNADILSTSDYYAFGSSISTRAIGGFRYSYNGHEKDDEVAGAGNHLSFGDYGLDTRLGRRWNIDPQWQRMPNQSPYSVNNNSPIAFADKDGKFAQLIIQYGVNVGINIMTQMITAYMLDPNVHNWEQAWDKTSLWQAFGEGAVDMIGTKKLKMAANAVMGMATYVDQVGMDNVNTQGLMTSGMIGLLEPIVGDAIAKYGSKYVASMLSSKMGLASKTIKQLTGVWHSATDGNFVGNLANKLGNVVEDIDMNFKFSGGAGDVDIVTKTMNIEVKSGNKMKLTQSLKNAEYAKSQGKSYGLYMPNATKAQIAEASKQGVTVYTTEEALKKAIGN